MTGTAPAMLDDDGPALRLASEGDHAAQIAMADHVVACALAEQVPLGVGLGAAEVFARMAAESGKIEHRRYLAGVLLWQASNLWDSGYYQRSRIYQVEAIDLMNGLADDGDEHSAALLSQHAAAFSPAILKCAADLVRSPEPRADGSPHTATKH